MGGWGVPAYLRCVFNIFSNHTYSHYNSIAALRVAKNKPCLSGALTSLPPLLIRMRPYCVVTNFNKWLVFSGVTYQRIEIYLCTFSPTPITD